MFGLRQCVHDCLDVLDVICCTVLPVIFIVLVSGETIFAHQLTFIVAEGFVSEEDLGLGMQAVG